MFDRLGELVSKRWAAMIVGWLLLAAGLFAVAPRWEDVTRDGDLAYLPDRMTSVRAEKLLAEAFVGDGARSHFAVVAVPKSGRPLDEEDLEWIESFAERLRGLESPQLPLLDVWTSESDQVHGQLVSEDGKAALVVLPMPAEFLATSNIAALSELQRQLDIARADESFPADLTLSATGSAATCSRLPARASPTPNERRFCSSWLSCSSSIGRRCWL